MREILFRGKRLDNGEWVEGLLMAFSPRIAVAQIGTFTDFGHYVRCDRSLGVDINTVGKYTGLKDKNGDRIFEGDVIKCEDSSQAVYGIVKYGQFKSYTVEQIGVYIEWQNENANRWCDWLRQDILFWIKRGDCEIVSNIHDNPELLPWSAAERNGHKHE